MLGDLPLLGWTAEAVRRSGLENPRCLLSTDDAEIAAIGKAVGLDVPFLRPPHLATDETGAVDVAIHALDWIKESSGKKPEYLMWLQPTSPFRAPEIIRQAFSTLVEEKLDAIIGVKHVSRSLGTLFYANDEGLLEPLERQATVITRRQAVRPMLTPNGAMYAVRSEILRSSNTFMPARCGKIVMNQIMSHDIDDPIDWDVAEALTSAGLTWRRRPTITVMSDYS